MTKDLRHRSLIQTALKKYEVARDARKARFQDWQSARQTAAEIKWDAINHLDKYLTELVDKLEARGTKVHWATTGEQARQIILGIVREKKARSVIKSKVMTGEEIHLNEALERAGLAVVESDFGEYIVQLRHEAPTISFSPQCISSAGKSAICSKGNLARSRPTAPRNS